jgi:2-oxoisovalerate dehydrogenase E1 component
MIASRYTDQIQADAAQRGEVFFYIPSSGHEASALIAPHLTPSDWLHLHYRDRALAYARGVTYQTVFDGLFSRASSNSGGRRMPAFPSDRKLNIMSTPTLVGSNVVQAVGVAHTFKDEPASNSIVLASVGDGATQQGDFYEAVSEAARANLPVLFLIEDNRYALSTPTKGNTFYSLPDGTQATDFCGVPIDRVNGSHPIETDQCTQHVIQTIRDTQSPRILIFEVERLASHTNADDQSVYRSEADLKQAMENKDPCATLREHLLEQGHSEESIRTLEEETRNALNHAFQSARKGPAPKPAMTAKRALPAQRSEYLGADISRDLSMLEAMRETLRHQLKTTPSTLLFGQDIEDPKGDVFGLTRGLSGEFPRQVKNSPLAENTILGVATGWALTGRRPIAFMQFADFLPVAYNHLISEIGAMYWRTNGDWEAPVTLMAIAGAYRPGLGPYHAQTLESICAHIPGLDVFMPSTAADASGLLNAIETSGRPSLFLFPKSLINDRSRTTSADTSNHYVPIGKARVQRVGQELTLLSWGSTMPLCEAAGEAFAEAGINIEVIDLRTLFPWDEEAVLNSVKKTTKLVIVHEDNRTCGMGAEVAASITETLDEPIQIQRVTRPDTYIPYDFSAQLEVMPSFRKVVETCAQLLDVDLHWQDRDEQQDGTLLIKAIGSSPSDETITVTTFYAAPGQTVSEGELLASVEADKASMDISAPVAGTVVELFAEEGDQLAVGQPLLMLTTLEEVDNKPVTEENSGTPILSRRRPSSSDVTSASTTRITKPIYLSNITTVLGSQHLTNDQILQGHEGWDSEAIRKRTGIENRYWIGKDENVLSLAVKATQQLLIKEQLDISEIGALICSTGTPLSMTPSLACRVLNELSPDKGEVLMQAHDVNAACSGYLYALQSAFDFISNAPTKKVIVITAETLSPMVNRDDPKTYPLFGDAATASLICCEERAGSIGVKLNRPVLSATGVDPKVLYVPNLGSDEFIEMEGLTVFKLAVRKMIDMLDQACIHRGITSEALDYIVPHQANERIIEAIRKTIHCPPEKMFNHISKYGNTSSNTIPIALHELMPTLPSGNRVGLTAFGGGFTFGAAVIEKQ